ncbi:MAG: NAD-dependent epimerase/dehydratase family protein [Crocinitomicaceae bacterium]|nr:NAD-dependent epimerase/dehydratase family protein [Crocinitomicaceae bacterium]
MQTILGANGTIGSLLAKELYQYTQKIRLVSRNPKKVNQTDELFPADLSNVSQVEKAVAGSDVVYLMVGFDYKTKVWQEKWPKLMRATIDACIKHHSKLVFFDNVYMYDPKSIPHMTEDSPLNPTSKKGMVRKEISDMLMYEIKASKLKGLIARSADFYGPKNEKSFLIEVVYKKFLEKKKANWFMNANVKHSFTFTPDAAKATALLGNTDDAFNQVWHLPTDPNALTGKQMIELFGKEMNVDPKFSVLSMFMLKLAGIFVPLLREMPEMMYQYDRDYIFDSSKFDKRFDFKTTSYQQGVKAIVASGK